MPKKIESIKHKGQKRAHIPSQEEAGYEDAAVGAQKLAPNLDIPKNPVVTRGQDPELFWLNKYGSDNSEETYGSGVLKYSKKSTTFVPHFPKGYLRKNLFRILLKIYFSFHPTLSIKVSY